MVEPPEVIEVARVIPASRPTQPPPPIPPKKREEGKKGRDVLRQASVEHSWKEATGLGRLVEVPQSKSKGQKGKQKRK